MQDGLHGLLKADLGANAVVLKDVPAGALAVGVPARIILPKPAEGTEAQKVPDES